MSYNIRNIREISNDPLTKFTNQLAKKLARFLNDQQQEKLESKEDIYSSGQDIDSVIRFHTFVSTKKFNFDAPYYPPLEPDNDKLRVWIRGRNMGLKMKDWSGKGREIEIFGEPILVDGAPHDDGIHSAGIKSTALRFNRPTSIQENDEFIRVDHDTNCRVSEGLSGGISFFIRFRLFDRSKQGGAELRLFEKTDNNPITDGVQAVISNGGRLKFHIKNSNVDYAWQTTTDAIQTDIIYDCWFTYNKTGNVVKIYINGVEQTLTTTTAMSWHSDQTNFDMDIFQRGPGSAGGAVYGDLYDYRLYREKTVLQSEVTNMWNNKWTIADIPFGQVMITDYYSTYNDTPSAMAGSFTEGSFTNISFTATGSLVFAVSYTPLSYTAISYTTV